MIFTPLVQNDKQLNEYINRAGCLFRSLSMLAEVDAKKTLGPEQIQDLYHWLITQGHMDKNCWVRNHEAVIKGAQFYLGVPQSAKYVMREEADEHDFSAGEADYFIRHIRTVTGTGHFYVCDRMENRTWDPFWPAPATGHVLGVRGYKL